MSGKVDGREGGARMIRGVVLLNEVLGRWAADFSNGLMFECVVVWMCGHVHV